jgi:hypothetical protein
MDLCNGFAAPAVQAEKDVSNHKQDAKKGQEVLLSVTLCLSAIRVSVWQQC